MERRVFLTILVCLGIMIAWQAIAPKLFPEWFPPPPEVTEPAPDAGTTAAAEAPADPTGATVAADPVAAGTEDPSADPVAAAAPNAPSVLPEEEVVLESPVVRAVFTSRGAALRSWKLRSEQFTTTVDENAEQVDVIRLEDGDPLPFSTTFDGLGWPADASYRVASKTQSSVTFEATGGGVTVRKTYRLAEDRYVLAFDFGFVETGGAAKKLTPTVHLARTVDASEEAGGGFFSFVTKPMPDVIQPACAFDDDIERWDHDPDEPFFAHTGQVHWVGIDSRYFLTAVFQGAPDYESEGAKSATAPGTCRIEVPQPRRLRAQLTLDPIELGAGASHDTRLTGYLGPKFKTRLAPYGHELNRSIDFGFFGILSMFLLYLMSFFEGLVGNWGVAIILLTLSVKGALLPLTNWSMKSMEKMRAIQPKMKELKEKHGKDQQRFQQEMMKMYREEGVSPFGGCLPMMLQLPIWIALYRTILNTAELYHAAFIPGWLDDLSAPEHGAVKFLPIAMGVTMFLMQRMQPMQTTGDDTQARMQKTMLYFMPPFFTLIMYGLPSGLTLYIFVNNILSIIQQYVIRKKQQAETEAKAEPVKSGGKKSK